MKEQFTQGDWSVSYGTLVRIGDIHYDMQNPHDAHLIAAAPKLYRELQLLKMFVHSLEESIPNDGLGLAQAASSIEYLLAEARGEK